MADVTKQFLEACEAGLQLVVLTQEPNAVANSSGVSSSCTSESSRAAPSNELFVQVEWLTAKGPFGRLHIKGVGSTMLFGRTLRDPEEGNTLYKPQIAMLGGRRAVRARSQIYGVTGCHY